MQPGIYSAGADAAIAGSAIVAIIEKYRDDVDGMKEALKNYAISMRAATNSRMGQGRA